MPRPPKPPTGGQAVTAQLIVVSIWAAGKGDNGSQRAGLPTSTMMVASVLAFHLDHGSQRAGLPTSTMMVASVLALPSQQWQPACWLPLPVIKGTC